jgi:hypothetical protein
MGLAALALEGNPGTKESFHQYYHLTKCCLAFPTFPERMTDAQVNSGLVLPYAAVALMGSGGAVCALLIVFMAVTSALSSELIAVSSIFTYDIYQTYFNVSYIHRSNRRDTNSDMDYSPMLVVADSSM